MVKRKENSDEFDYEYSGFGRFIDYLGDNYSIGWRENGFLNGYARRVQYFNGQDLLNPPVVTETIWREGFEIDRKRHRGNHKYDHLEFDEDDFMIAATSDQAGITGSEQNASKLSMISIERLTHSSRQGGSSKYHSSMEDDLESAEEEGDEDKFN